MTNESSYPTIEQVFDEGYAKGYQAALDDLSDIIVERKIKIDKKILANSGVRTCLELLSKIQELKEKQND